MITPILYGKSAIQKSDDFLNVKKFENSGSKDTLCSEKKLDGKFWNAILWTLKTLCSVLTGIILFFTCNFCRGVKKTEEKSRDDFIKKMIHKLKKMKNFFVQSDKSGPFKVNWKKMFDKLPSELKTSILEKEVLRYKTENISDETWLKNQYKGKRNAAYLYVVGLDVIKGEKNNDDIDPTENEDILNYFDSVIQSLKSGEQ